MSYTKSATDSFRKVCGWDGDFAKAKELLKSGKVDVNCVYIDKPGEALWDACYHGLDKIVDLILMHSDFDPKIKKHKNSLYYAAKYGYHEIVLKLLSKIEFSEGDILNALFQTCKLNRELAFQVLYEYCENHLIDISFLDCTCFTEASRQENFSIGKYLLRNKSILKYAIKNDLLSNYYSKDEIKDLNTKYPEFILL